MFVAAGPLRETSNQPVIPRLSGSIPNRKLVVLFANGKAYLENGCQALLLDFCRSNLTPIRQQDKNMEV
jgi:hypothetical protein